MFMKIRLTFTLALLSILALSAPAQAQDMVCPDGLVSCYTYVFCETGNNIGGGGGSDLDAYVCLEAIHLGCLVPSDCGHYGDNGETEVTVIGPGETLILRIPGYTLPDSRVPVCPTGTQNFNFTDASQFEIPDTLPLCVFQSSSATDAGVTETETVPDAGSSSDASSQLATDVATPAAITCQNQYCDDLSRDDNTNNSHSHGCSALPGSHRGGFGGVLLALLGLCWLSLKKSNSDHAGFFMS
jgi:hypothetical protein